MPMYEYACQDCESKFETLVFSADEAVECPGCQGTHLEKLLSVPSAGTAPDAECGMGACGTGACAAGMPPACGTGGCGMM